MDTVTIIVLCVVAAALLYAAARYIYFYKKEHFECPKCGWKFKPSVRSLVFSVNAVEGKIIKCPHCGSKEYMEPKKDEI